MGELGRSGYGPNGYSSIKFFKALILQAWHNLSDKVKQSQGAILDATIIESAANPRKQLEVVAVDREEDAFYLLDLKIPNTIQSP